MMTHTPGPWKAEDRGHRVHGIRFFWLVPDKVSLGSANPADADLAAAAPDLLVAAEEMLAAFAEGVEWHPAQHAAYTRLHAAIARAKGE